MPITEIDGDQIQDDTVTSDDIQDDTVTNNDLNFDNNYFGSRLFPLGVTIPETKILLLHSPIFTGSLVVNGEGYVL